MDDAFQALYGGGGRDLTAEGYLEALGNLRKADPAAARRAERLLAPLLKERLFRRRSREWYETSEGTRVRLKLLPGNPHVQADVQTIRGILGIPNGHIKATENDALWKHLAKRFKPQVVKRVVEGNLTGWWIQLHRKSAMGQVIEAEEQELLSSELFQSATASAVVDLTADQVPEWLRQPPLGPPPYHQQAVPLDRAAGRLVERHRLPWHAAAPLAFYILTQDPDRLTKLDPFSADVVYEDIGGGDPDAFMVSVRGIDEFMTRADWNNIWERYIRPRQENLWERRGMKPQGRRTVNIERLQSALPLYRDMVQQSWTMKNVFEEALVEWDQETIRRAISDLGKLLAPVS
jgi:hypothetical protein